MSPPEPGEPSVVTVVCSHPGDVPPGLGSRLGRDAETRFAHDAAQLAAALPGTEIIFVWDFQSDQLRQMWATARAVAWVHVASAGVEPLLFPELQEQVLALTNSRGVFDTAIAEFVLGSILAAAKDLPRTLRLQDHHEWRHRESRLVAGSTMLVIGAGSIGAAVARLAHAAGCQVIGVARAAREHPDFTRIVALESLDDVLPLADYVVVTAPLTPQTEKLLGSSAFARCKPRTVLVNVGRGPIVDEDALIEALDSGRVSMAILDVFREEPLPATHPYWERPDVVVSPHMCGDYEGFRTALVDLFVDNFRRWRSGMELVNVVNWHRGY